LLAQSSAYSSDNPSRLAFRMMLSDDGQEVSLALSQGREF